MVLLMTLIEQRCVNIIKSNRGKKNAIITSEKIEAIPQCLMLAGGRENELYGDARPSQPQPPKRCRRRSC